MIEQAEDVHKQDVGQVKRSPTVRRAATDDEDASQSGRQRPALVEHFASCLLGVDVMC